MLTRWNSKLGRRIAIGLAACWLVCPRGLSADTLPGILVVVASEEDAECVEQIGREHVHVERLFSPECGAVPNNYEACDQRVRGLLEFRLFIFRDDTSRASEVFWQQRMTGANPRGKVLRLSQSRCSVLSDCERRIQRTTLIHRALVSVLPGQRATLDENLRSELHRLQLLRVHPLQFAVRW